jgi:predicted AlkP superfamily phosphohydrolase/phosphomutase
MRFLRMLTNSLIAGALGAAYLTVLVLQLNPQIPLFSASAWRWFETFALFYGVHLAAIFYVAMVAREFFSLDVLSPGWASVRVLAWLGAIAAAVAATLMWLNLEGFATALDAATARRMRAGAAATSASAVVLLGIAVAHYSFGRRGSRVGAALFTIAVVGSLALPLAARGSAAAAVLPTQPVAFGWRQAQPGPRVTMLLLDGGSLDYILPRAADGRLPNFSRVLDRAGSLPLATVRPTQPDPVWAAVATGMYSSKNGVRSAASYYPRDDPRAADLLPDYCFSHLLVHLGFVRSVPKSSSAWRARPLWTILSDAGIPVGVVRWPLTYPAPTVQGFVLTDRFHELLGSMFELEDRVAYPPGIMPVARAAFTEPLQVAVDPIAAAVPAAMGDTVATAAVQRDRLYGRAMSALRAKLPVRVSALRYVGLDIAGHRYLRYTQPRSYGDVPEEERRRYAQVIDRYYSYIDAEVGLAVDTLAEGDLLLIVSGFGMERLNPIKQALGRLLGDPDLTGTHERAPDGFLLAYGTTVEPGRHRRGSIVDITPTILYFLGLPVGRDMDGFARADIFTRDFRAQRPIAFIPTHNR